MAILKLYIFGKYLNSINKLFSIYLINSMVKYFKYTYIYFFKYIFLIICL